MGEPRSRMTVIVGLGVTGLSAARHLAGHGIACAVVDSRLSPPGVDALRDTLPDLPLFTGGWQPDLLAHAVELVVSPGVPLSEPAVAVAAANGVPTFGDIELFARAARAPVAAVTGSNGKSTVTTLLGEMAIQAGRCAHVGGNLGPPALDLLPVPSWAQPAGEEVNPRTSGSEPDLYVVELSSFQLETTYSLTPAVAALLNISADHMDRYPDLDAYVRAKMRVFDGASAAVICRDDGAVVRACTGLEQQLRVITFGTGVPGPGDLGVALRDGEPWLCRGDDSELRYLMPQRDVPLVGAHNVSNVLAALAMAEVLDIPVEPAVRAVKAFQGLEHRCELVSRGADRTWINDSKGANVGATIAAVAGLAAAGPLVLIAGGDGKGADFAPLSEALAGRARAVVLLGQDGPRIASEIESRVPYRFAASMAEAVSAAFALSEPGDVIALSPACASWDMYPSYQVRGREFAELARAFVASEEQA